MKILLAAVNAKYIHSCPAVYSLRAACGCPEIVEIAEFTINDRYQDILAGILAREADIIGLSTYIWNTDVIEDLAEDIRRVRRGSVILFAGGPEASCAPERFLGSCDFVICWEGEKPFSMITELVAGLREEKTCREMILQHEAVPCSRDICAEEELKSLVREIRSRVPGIAYFNGTQLVVSPAETGQGADIDETPFLYDDLAPFASRIIYYESSRGCPFGCTYCLSSIDRHVRFRGMDKVLRELQYFIDREVPQVKFIDRTFNISRERAMTIWSYLRDHDNGKTNFHFEIGAELLSESELALLETLRPGLIQLEIGIQSTNAATLDAICRKTDMEKLFKNIRRLRRARNIHLHADLIAGLPYEGYQEFARSFNDVYALHADELQLGFLKVLKGTAIYERAGEYDIRYSGRPPYEVLSTKWISYTELGMLRRICDVLEYYYNSRQFIHSLEYLERYWESAFSFYRDLAVFFREHGYDRAKPAAAARYEVLLEFVREASPMKDMDSFNMAVFREYLRLDKTLHIMKSRRRGTREEYDFGEGKVLVVVDYEHRDVLTGEAAWTVSPI